MRSRGSTRAPTARASPVATADRQVPPPGVPARDVVPGLQAGGGALLIEAVGRPRDGRCEWRGDPAARFRTERDGSGPASPPSQPDRARQRGPGVVVLDQLTKHWVVTTIEPRMVSGEGPIELLGGLLKLTYTENTGAAFSMGTGYTWIFSIVAVVVAVVILRTARRLGSIGWAVALGGLLGGAAGQPHRSPDAPTEPGARVRRRLDPAPELRGVQRRGHVRSWAPRPSWCCWHCAASRSPARARDAAPAAGARGARGERLDIALTRLLASHARGPPTSSPTGRCSSTAGRGSSPTGCCPARC